MGNAALSHPESDERERLGSTSLATLEEAHTNALALANFQLEAATKDDFRTELTSCLTLVVPSGMSREDRREWLLAAWATLRDIPADLLRRGCAAARKQADHPAKIVPAIMAEIGTAWDRRKTRRSEATAAWADRDQPTTSTVEFVTPEQVEAIKAEVGLVTQPFGEAPKPLAGPARMPTLADYAALGVDTAVLAMLKPESG
jgi:hypothetical protein